MRARTLLLLPLFWLLAASPGHADSDDEVVAALADAIAAYGTGDLEAALGHVEVARGLLSQALGDVTAPPPTANRVADRYRSNAGELLECLQYYEIYALGADPALDGIFAYLRRELGAIEHFNHVDGKPSSSGGIRLSWDPFTHLVREIDDLDISYDPFTKKITQIGKYKVDYNPFSKLPTKIGGIEYDWDPFDRTHLRQVAGKDVD